MNGDALQYVIQRADFTVTLANTFLVQGALFIALATIGITIYFNAEKNKNVDKAISEVLQKIGNDDKIKDELIRHILSGNDFKQELKATIDIAVRDQIDLDNECISASNEDVRRMKEKI